MSQNNETAAIVVYQTNPVGVEPFSYEKTSFVQIKLCERKTLSLFRLNGLGRMTEYQGGRERW